MNGFLLKLLANAVKDPDIRAFLFELADRLGGKLIATFPLFAGSIVKLLTDKVPNIAAIPEDAMELAKETAKHIVDSDPDIPGLSDIIDLSELARKWLNL